MRTYIPNNIKSFRKAAGLRQQDLADKLGIVAFYRISRWEKGIAYPSIENLFKMARIFNVHAGDLYRDMYTSINGEWITRQ